MHDSVKKTNVQLSEGIFPVEAWDLISNNDEEEATKIIEWLKREINAAWENRREIEPSYESAPIPKVLEILKLLPKNNCKECGQTTCMVFASMVAEGAKDAEDCPPLEDSNSNKLSEYMRQFHFDF